MPKYTKDEVSEARASLQRLLNPHNVRYVNEGEHVGWFSDVSNGEPIRAYGVRERVREHLPTVYFVIASVSRSGMSRTVRVYVDGEQGLRYITAYCAKVLGWRIKRDYKDGVVVDGCGMDMCFHLLNCVTFAVFGYGPNVLSADHFRREVL